MSRGIFITGTGTDVGKTYITAMLIKTLRQEGYNCGYYKAAISGAENITQSDAGYVNKIAKIEQKESSLLSYLYKTPVSPHLAARIEGNPLCMDSMKLDYEEVCKNYDFVVMEGSGGIICPIRWDEQYHILLEDIIKELSLPTLVVADAGLGTINATVLTIAYLKNKNISVKGIILNHYKGSEMEIDNIKMIETLTDTRVIATVKESEINLNISAEKILQLFSEEK